MRNLFAEEIERLATEDPRIVLLSGDIGNRLFDRFKEKFPNRFYNCGVAEANMASVAAGLGMCGLIPITYTITPFNTIRCLEQIRIDICYHYIPVIIVGTGSGLSYGSLGATHHSCDDIALMRCLPNMSVVCPADNYELKKLLQEALLWKGPVYLRIGKKGEPGCYTEEPNLTIGKGHIFQKGKDICLISTGNTLSLAKEVSKKFESLSIYPGIVSMHTVKPLDTDLLQTLAIEYSLLVSIEEHSLIGGLGSSIAEWIVDSHQRVSLLRIGTPDVFPHKLGSQKYLREQFSLTPEAIFSSILQEYESCVQNLPS